MLPFTVDFRPGESPYREVVYAATRAIVAGRLKPGERFPSVRALSRELKVNPNTAHKVVAQLVNGGLLEVRPGVGTVVAEVPSATRRERAALLRVQVEQLVVEAKRLSLNEQDVVDAVRDHWRRLSGEPAPAEEETVPGG